MEILALLCLITAIGLLVLLAVIDFKTFLLPNIYVAPFALLGIAFHLLTDFYYLSSQQMLIGGVAGYGLLYVIRAAGNKYYGQDSLGLGDVKLLGASGLWLGIEGVLFAMTLGAMVGLIHGLTFALYKKIKTKQPFSLSRLTIPAGPGFVIGILLVGAWLYQSFIIQLTYDFLP
jgi:prepilin signal peptidase PulO-like enzyme (type II secretory pathway)